MPPRETLGSRAAPARMRPMPRSALSSCASASSSVHPISAATATGIARSMNGRPSRSATAGPTTLPPAPNVAEIVTMDALTTNRCPSAHVRNNSGTSATPRRHRPPPRGPVSEQRGRQRAPSFDHPQVVVGQHLEQLEQMDAHLVAIVAGRAADRLDQPVEGVLDATRDQLDVGLPDLRLSVIGAIGGILFHLRHVEALDPSAQVDQREAALGVRVL